jgi:hypothetical protein
MKARVFLIMNRAGGYRVTKRPPYLDRGEVCLRLAVTIPDACFTSPVIDVAVDVPPDQVQRAECAVDLEIAEAG